MENDPIFHAILLAKRMARGGYADGGDTSDPIAYANSLLGYGDAASQSSLNNSGLPTSLPMGIAPSVAKPSAMQTPGTPSSVQPDISGLSAPAAGQAAPSVAAGPAAPTPSTPAPTPTPAVGKPAAKKDETTSTNTQKRGGRVGYYDGGLIDLDTPVLSTQQNIGLYGIDWGNPDSSADFFRADQQLQKALAVSNQILNGNSDVDNNTNPRLIPPEVIPNPTPNNVPLPPVRPSNLGDETTDTSTQAPPASAPQGGSTVPPPQNVNVKGVDPRLIDIYNEASKSLPEGYSVQLTSGYRAGDPRFHGQGKAVDFQITDANGNVLNNYQNLPAFRTYEQFAQSARKAQMQMYPELNDQLRWGGYFSGKTHPFGGPYGAVDIMHLDLGGDKVGMQGGSWAGGLTDAQRKLLQNKAISQGMGQGYASGGTPEADLSNQDKIVRDALLTANSMPKEDLFSGNLNQYNTNATLSDGNLSASFGSVNPIEQSSGASLYPMFNTTLGAQLSPKFNTSFTRQTPLSNSQSGSSNIASFGYNDSDISSNAQFGDTPSGRMYGATFGKNNADSNLNLFGNYTPKTHNFTGGVEYSKRFASGGMVDHALRKAYATDGTVTDPADTPTAGDYQPTGDPDLDTALQQISDAKKEMDQGATEYKQPISERIQSGASAGFGSQPIGYNPEDQQKIDDISKQYPYLEMPLNIAQGIYQSVATPISLAGRGINALVGGTSGAIAGTYGEATGADETDVNKLQRDLNSLGQSALIETGRTGDIPAVKEEAPIINNTPIVDKALSKIPEEPEPLPATNIPETSKPSYSQVDPEGNLNLRPSVKAEDLKGPDVQTVDSFINQLKGKQGFTPDSLEEIKSQFADKPTVSKDDFANNMPASQYNKEPLDMQNYDQAKGDIDDYFNSQYENLPQFVASKVLKDAGHSFYNKLLNELSSRDYIDDSIKTPDMIDRFNLAQNSANEFITLPVQVKYFLSHWYGINNFRQLRRMSDDFNTQTTAAVIRYPEQYPEFFAQYNSKLNQARNNLTNMHNEQIDHLNDQFGNSNVIKRPKYRNVQRLVFDKDNPSLRENYFEMGVSHPNYDKLYKHFSNFNNGIGHFRGTMTPDGASILNADKPGENLSQSMLQTKPNSAVIEEIQSDAQQTNQQTGPLRQVHGVVAKAAIQHALENGANTIYFPTSKPIIARRLGPKESWENIPDKVNQATALHRIYDKEVPKFALDEIKKIPGVTHSMTDGGFYHVFDFNDAAKDRILNGAGMRTPGYKKGGAVVNQALSVLSKYGSTLPDADVILRQLKRGRP